MAMYYCAECGNEFREPIIMEEKTGVYAPDGIPETWEYEVCPSCGSENIDQRELCEVCRIRPRAKCSDYCSECKKIIATGVFAFLKRYAAETDAKIKDVYKCFEEVIEEELI